MRHLKRVTALILLGLCACLSGCSFGRTKEPTKVTIWHYYNDVQQVSFNQMVNDFNNTIGQERNIVVESISQGSVNDVSARLTDAMDGVAGADPLPNAASLYADAAYGIYVRELAVDYADYFSKSELETYVPAYLTEGNFDNSEGIYLLPIAKSTEVFMLNQTDWEPFAAATGATDDAFQTWEGITRVAEQYYKWSDAQTPDVANDGKAFFGRDALANYMYVGTKQLGHELLLQADGKTSLQLDEATLRRLWDNYYVPYVNGWFTANGRFRSDDVKTGSCIALVGSTSGAAYFPSAVTREDGTSYDIEARTYPLPNFEGTPPFAVQQGAGMLMLKSDKAHEQATATFLKWFTAQEQNLDFCVGSGYLPVTISANSQSAILEAADAAATEVTDTLRHTQLVGAETALSYSLYTPPAFTRGAEMRPIVENSLSDLAVADHAQAVALASAQGIPMHDAAARFTTDENFTAWINSLRDALEALF